MNQGNNFSNSSGLPNELAGLTGPAAGEANDTINDQDVSNLIAHDPNTAAFPIMPAGNDEPPIEAGYTEPITAVNQPAITIINQPAELNDRHQQTADGLTNIPSPEDLDITIDHYIPLSTHLQTIRVHTYTSDDDIQLIERTAVDVAVPEDEGIHIEQTETTAIEPVESPVQNGHGEQIDIVDLTQDDDQGSEHPEIHSIGTVSPATVDLTTEDDNEEIVEIIDLTGDNDEHEGPIQMASGADHNEQVNQSEPDPPAMPIREQVAPAAAPSSSEATDQNIIFATTTDHRLQPMETTAQLQVPRLQSRNKKRSISSDEKRRGAGQRLSCEVKRGRYTIV